MSFAVIFRFRRALLPAHLGQAPLRLARRAASASYPDGVPIAGIAGDQQAALFGQGGLRARRREVQRMEPARSFLQHTGDKRWRSRHRLLSSLAAMPTGKPQFVLEGSVL